MAVPATLKFDGKTGSVVRFLEIFKRISKANEEMKLVVRTTLQIGDYFKQNGLNAEIKVVKSSLKFYNYFDLVWKAMFLTLKLFLVFGFPEAKKNEKVTVYATSDLFWETLPAFFFKIKQGDVKWLQIIHHIYPDWRKRAGNKINNFFGYYLQKFSFLLIKKKADKIIVLNNQVKKDLLNLGFPWKKVILSSNGIDLEFIKNIPPAQSSYDGIYLGRLSQSKGTADLIEIWKKVILENPGAKLAVIGGGKKDEIINLKKKVQEEGLINNIWFLGFLEDKEAISILKSGKVYIFPSHEEGWGIAVAEALAAGLPTVVWNLPVYSDIFRGNVLEIEENNFDLFSQKVLELLKNDSLRRNIAKSGQDFIQKYSWNKVVGKELEIIKNL